MPAAWTPSPYGIDAWTVGGQCDVADHRRERVRVEDVAAVQRAAPSATRSRRRRGDRARGAGGGDDRGERRDRRAVGEVDRSELGAGAVEAVAMRDRAARRPVDLLERVVEIERSEEARPQLRRRAVAADALGDEPEQEVVRVRVVPSLAGLEVGACRRTRASAPRPTCGRGRTGAPCRSSARGRSRAGRSCGRAACGRSRAGRCGARAGTGRPGASRSILPSCAQRA